MPIWLGRKPARGSIVLGAHGTGGVPTPPAGFILLVDYDGAYLTDADGAYLMEPA